MTESVLSGRSPKGAVSERKRLLVVDDEPEILDIVVGMLEEDGWDITGILDGTEALATLQREPFDLVLLDLKLPGINGFEVLRRARQSCSVPIVALSALHSIEDRERFLSLGGDDYITKPYNSTELRFRAWAALRKKREMAANASIAPNEPPAQPDFSDGYLTVDLEARRVTVGGKEIVLPPKEHGVLRELVVNTGKVLTHEHLLKTIWGPEFISDVNLLHTCVARLRSKIEPDQTHPRYVITVDRVGYRFRNSA